MKDRVYTNAEVAALVKVRDLARALRKYQKAYFRSKNAEDLKHAKDYERRVDAALEEADGGSPGLFDGG